MEAKAVQLPTTKTNQLLCKVSIQEKLRKG